MKNISIIACISSDQGLGRGNDLLWRIPADQRFFRQTTLGHPVVMGGKTFRSIGRPLPGRQNLVLTSQPLCQMDNQSSNRGSGQASNQPVESVKSAASSTTLQSFARLSELEKYLATLDGEVFVIGGATLYRYFLPQAQTLYLTEVDAVQPAEVYFPEFNEADFTAQILQTGEISCNEALTHDENMGVEPDATIKYRMVKYERR